MAGDILNLNDKRLVRLPPAQLARELMRLPAKKRMEVIMERPDAEAVAAAMDVGDFFFTIQEIGPDDSIPLLALSTRDQMDHLFDIEWWKKDEIEPARSLTWLDRLSRASDPKLLEWLYHADFELLIALFKKCITVEVAPEDIDLTEARQNLPERTLDDYYFWEPRYPQYDELIMHVLTLIFEVNYTFYKELMSHVLSAPSHEMEELAHQFHQARLSEKAIPDYYDALEIYRNIKREEFGQKPPAYSVSPELAPPSFALALVPDSDLLGRVLIELDRSDLIEMLQIELASLSSKVIVADQVQTDSGEALRRAVEKASAYVNLGLEIVSGGDFEKARSAVENIFLEHIFRLAHSKIAQVRGRLRSLVKYGWLGQCTTGTKCLDGEWFDEAELLLAKTPKLLRRPLESVPGAAIEDFFRSPRDLALANRIVDAITAVGPLYNALGADPSAIQPRLWAQGQIRSVEDITVGVLVLTAAARFLYHGNRIPEPLPAAEWPAIFPLLQPTEIDRVVMDWVHLVIADQQARGLAVEYLTPVLRDYETEMRPFSGLNPPEPQLVRFFMFQGPG